MEISDRKKKILKAIIDDFIENAEPVGSKSIAEHSDLGLSSATIRNEMAELTNLGYLEQPHTSAGRVPSPMGYRMYVNELMRRHKLSLEETERINRSLTKKMQQLDVLISDAGRLVSQLTNYPVYALTAAVDTVTVKKFGFIFVDAHTFIAVAMLQDGSTENKLIHSAAPIDEGFIYKLDNVFNVNFTGITEEKIDTALVASTERVVGDSTGVVAAIAGYTASLLRRSVSGKRAYIAGTSHILEHPEYRDWDRAHRLIDYLSDADLAKLPAPDDRSPMKIIIGPENVADELRESSVVVASYDAGDGLQGILGVVGPTRMDYAKVAARLSYIAQGLHLLLSGEEIPPPPIERK